MSLSYQPLKPIEVLDPVINIKNERDYAVMRGGDQVSYKGYTTTSISQSSIQFSCPPPSGQIIVDRKVFLKQPVRLTFTGNAPVGQTLLQSGFDAPRAFPLSSAIDTFQATINNLSVSINMSDIVQALQRYNTDEKLKGRDYSQTPCYMDQSQVYSSLNQSNRSPLGTYADSLGDENVCPRGGFSMVVQSNTQTAAVVDLLFTEPLFLSPFYFGKDNAGGFYNVNSMDFNITYLQAAPYRMWSHDSSSAGSITSITAQFSGFSSVPAPFAYFAQPQMLFRYITPPTTMGIPYDMPISYPYFDVVRYPTDFNAAIAPLDIKTISSNNIQLNSIPRRIYIFSRIRNNDLYSNANSTDTFFEIQKLSMTWENKTGLFSSATQEQLYQMSVKNHCNMSWNQWSGGPVTDQLGVGSAYYTVGSVLCIQAEDFGLSAMEAPGKQGQYTLQMDVTVRNINPNSITPTLYVVVVNEGTFTIPRLGSALANIGVISTNDILEARQQPGVDYNELQHVNGGNFLSGLKNFGQKVNAWLKEHKILSTVAKAIPFVGSTLSSIASNYGYGVGDEIHYKGKLLEMQRMAQGQGGTMVGGCADCPTGGVVVGGTAVAGTMSGGRKIKRAKLYRRMKKV